MVTLISLKEVSSKVLQGTIRFDGYLNPQDLASFGITVTVGERGYELLNQYGIATSFAMILKRNGNVDLIDSITVTVQFAWMSEKEYPGIVFFLNESADSAYREYKIIIHI